MRINQRTANIIANLTSSMGQHVRPKIIIKRASKELQTTYSPSTLILLAVALLLLFVTVFFIGGLMWYFFRQKPKDDTAALPIHQVYQLEGLERDLLEALNSPNRRSVIMNLGDDIITPHQIRAIARGSNYQITVSPFKDQISDASTVSKTQPSQHDPLASPELLEEKAVPILRLMQEGKRNFSLKLMTPNQEDSE